MLKKNYEFRKVLTKGNYFAGDCIQIVVLKSNGNRFYKNYNYIGIAVNTKFGKAVKRNKIKRNHASIHHHNNNVIMAEGPSKNLYDDIKIDLKK